MEAVSEEKQQFCQGQRQECRRLTGVLIPAHKRGPPWKHTAMPLLCFGRLLLHQPNSEVPTGVTYSIISSIKVQFNAPRGDIPSGRRQPDLFTEACGGIFCLAGTMSETWSCVVGEKPRLQENAAVAPCSIATATSKPPHHQQIQKKREPLQLLHSPRMTQHG